MICIFCRNEIRKLFSHVKEGHDRTGAEIAQSRSRLETITLVHLHDQVRKKIHGMLLCSILLLSISSPLESASTYRLTCSYDKNMFFFNII